MPDIDPAALSRTDSIAPSATTNTPITTKTSTTSGASAQKAAKAAPSAPRVDVEPLYTQLKSIIGDQWTTYKDSISRFVLGHLNQEELSREIDPVIGPEPHKEHLHNQLICAIFANALRDPPEQGVASWVSANDKPTTVSKPLTGDAAEQRLKLEVMQLPPRVRHRLKSIQDDPYNPITHAITTQSAAARRHPHGASPTQTSGSGASATTPTSAGLSKDTEIRRRYNIPLISESNDLPPLQLLTDRLLPICYEEGLSSGPSAPQTCADLLSTALEAFVKEMVVDILSRSQHNAPVSGPDASIPSANAPGTAAQPSTTSTTSVAPTAAIPGTLTTTVMTARYKRQLTAETAAAARGDLKRADTGLLPVETAQHHGKGAPGDLRLAWEMTDHWLGGLLPWMGERILAGDAASAALPLADLEMIDELDAAAAAAAAVAVAADDSDPAKANGVLTNGVNGAHDDPDPMAVDDPPGVTVAADAAPVDADWGWQGTAAGDRDALGSLLDDCLAVSQ